MATTQVSPPTNAQLKSAILLKVVTRFMDSNESTSRHSLVVEFEGQPVGQLLFELMNGSLLQRQDSPVPTANEKYLPGALAFEFCGNAQFREDAKFAATTILHTLKRIYRNEGDKEFNFEDLERYAVEMFSNKGIDSRTLKLGLYLVKNFGWLSQSGSTQEIHLSPFRVAEWVMSIANPDSEWEAVVARSTPKAPEILEEFASIEQDESAAPAITHQTFLPAGSQHDAYIGLREIFALPKREILIVDPYVDQTLWELLTNTGSNVNIQILTLSDHPKPANGYHLKTGQRE